MRLSDIMGQAGLAAYAELGLVLFFGVFLALAARTFLFTRGSTHLSQARIPLDDAEPQGSGATDRRGGTTP